MNHPPPEIEADGAEAYAVQSIVDQRWNAQRKIFQWLVRWEGFEDSEETWEQLEHLDGAAEALEEYRRDAGDIRDPAVRARKEAKNRGKNPRSGRKGRAGGIEGFPWFGGSLGSLFCGNMCNCLVAIICIVPGEDARTHVAWWESSRYSKAIMASDPQRSCFNTILLTVSCYKLTTSRESTLH